MQEVFRRLLILPISNDIVPIKEPSSKTKILAWFIVGLSVSSFFYCYLFLSGTETITTVEIRNYESNCISTKSGLSSSSINDLIKQEINSKINKLHLLKVIRECGDSFETTIYPQSTLSSNVVQQSQIRFEQNKKIIVLGNPVSPSSDCKLCYSGFDQGCNLTSLIMFNIVVYGSHNVELSYNGSSNVKMFVKNNIHYNNMDFYYYGEKEITLDVYNQMKEEKSYCLREVEIGTGFGFAGAFSIASLIYSMHPIIIKLFVREIFIEKEELVNGSKTEINLVNSKKCYEIDKN